MKKKNKNLGFTLVELLLVISIIALMSSVVLVSLNTARIKARDAKRKADIRTLLTALSLYYDQNRVYPNGGTVGTPNNETDIQNLASFLVPTYVNQIPNDPKPTNRNYQYVWGGSGQEYGLLVPFSNDGGTDCKWITPGGNNNWFRVGSVSVVNCSY